MEATAAHDRGSGRCPASVASAHELGDGVGLVRSNVRISSISPFVPRPAMIARSPLLVTTAACPERPAPSSDGSAVHVSVVRLKDHRSERYDPLNPPKRIRRSRGAS